MTGKAAPLAVISHAVNFLRLRYTPILGHPQLANLWTSASSVDKKMVYRVDLRSVGFYRFQCNLGVGIVAR